MTSRTPGAEQLPASFRDPSGFLFRQNNVLYRQINHVYETEYRQFEQSGLLAELIASELLVPHQTASIQPMHPELGSLVIQPEPIDFISYPYEWSFSQLQDSALLTLEIATKALAYDFVLKDCSAYNVQFQRGKPIFIDTLSFETYQDGEPWVAYRQFCQHFLAPLALMSMTDVSLNQLFRTNIDGVPLPLASALLPFRSRLSFSLLTHIHLHAKAQKKFSSSGGHSRKTRLSRHRFMALLDNLRSAIAGMSWKPTGTEWGDYYSRTNYSENAMTHKQKLVRAYLAQSAPQTVWDLGANTGTFSRIAAENAKLTVSFDIDPAAVETNYINCRSEADKNLLPLVVDFANPSPAIGWHHQERAALLERGPADTALALALIHHLSISNNLPFESVAAFLAQACSWLVIEFVPKSDSQVQRLLSSRKDIFPDYDRKHFESAFSRYFSVIESEQIETTDRTLYLMQTASAP